MQIALKPEQRRWLEEQVAKGHFSTIEDGVALAVGDLMALDPEGDALEWVKPLVDEAVGQIERGEGVPSAEAHAFLEARRKARR